VLEAYLHLAADALQPEEGADAAFTARLGGTLAAETARSRAALLEALDAPEHLALLDDLAALVGARALPRPGDRPAGADASADTDAADRSAARTPAPRGRRASVRHELRRTRAALRTARAAAGTSGADPALHEARKAAKRARYAAELVAPAVGKRAERTAAVLTEVQDLIGAHQDTVVARARVRDLAAAARAAGEDTVGYGVLHERLRSADPTRDAWRAFRAARRAWGR
jgi:CHAD domain-containing protein